MLLMVTILLLVFVQATFNCFRFSDVIYVGLAFLPCIMYYRKKSQVNLMLLYVNVFTISQLYVYVNTLMFSLGVKESGQSVWTIGDNTYTTLEYMNVYNEGIHDLVMLVVISVFAFMQIIYYAIESSSYIKKFNDQVTYTNCLRVYRDRLYSLKAMSLMYVVGVLLVIFFGIDTVVNKWLSCGIQILLFIFMYGVVSSIVNKEWQKQAKVVNDKIQQEMKVVDLDSEDSEE